jgi:hypothetical protein
VLAQLQSDYSDDVRVAYRHFPLLSIHDKAALSTQASEAAGAQGEFWAMHDLLFARQSEWAGFSPEEFESWLGRRGSCWFPWDSTVDDQWALLRRSQRLLEPGSDHQNG